MGFLFPLSFLNSLGSIVYNFSRTCPFSPLRSPYVLKSRFFSSSFYVDGSTFPDFLFPHASCSEPFTSPLPRLLKSPHSFPPEGLFRSSFSSPIPKISLCFVEFSPFSTSFLFPKMISVWVRPPPPPRPVQIFSSVSPFSALRATSLTSPLPARTSFFFFDIHVFTFPPFSILGNFIPLEGFLSLLRPLWKSGYFWSPPPDCSY